MTSGSFFSLELQSSVEDMTWYPTHLHTMADIFAFSNVSEINFVIVKLYVCLPHSLSRTSFWQSYVFGPSSRGGYRGHLMSPLSQSQQQR